MYMHKIIAIGAILAIFILINRLSRRIKMSDLNVFSCTGRLTKDAEIKLIGARQTPCCQFSIANNTGFGQYETTSYFDVQLWGSSGQNLVSYLTKGQPVAISGELTQNNWVDQNGQKHTNFRLSASKITLLNSSKPRSQSPVQDTSNPYEQGDAVF